MKIIVTNDGKEKYQSFEASINKDYFEAMSTGSWRVGAFGATRQEALTNLHSMVTAMKYNLELILTYNVEVAEQ